MGGSIALTWCSITWRGRRELRRRRGRKMLLLHADVFLAAREIVLQRALAELRAGPGPP